MFRKFFIVASLLVTTTAMATSFGEQATIADNEPAVLISGAGKNWTMLSMDNTRQMVKVRKFFDMGANGAQQIDYVVNCADKSVALAGFQVLKSSDITPPTAAAIPSFDDLSFHKHILDIDRNTENSACLKRLAMADIAQTN